jgi:hypothetical protein
MSQQAIGPYIVCYQAGYLRSMGNTEMTTVRSNFGAIFLLVK